MPQNCQAFASIKIFNGSTIFAHSLVIESKWGSGRGAPVIGDLEDLLAK